MCANCDEARAKMIPEVARRSGVDEASTEKVLLALEVMIRENHEQEQAAYAARAEAMLAEARDANPELFAMLTAAGAEFTVEELAVPADGFPAPAPAHERDVPEPRRGMYL